MRGRTAPLIETGSRAGRMNGLSALGETDLAGLPSSTVGPHFLPFLRVQV